MTLAPADTSDGNGVNMSRDPAKTRSRIIAAADELFYGDSLRGVSVDEVAAKAGITKKTLYYHFSSKDELIAAYLTARDKPTIERFKDWGGDTGTVAERMGRMFDRLGLLARSRDWLGCGFLRVTAELANMPGHPALDVARAHKRAFQAWLCEMLIAEGHQDPQKLAQSLMILVDGTVSQLLMHRDPTYASAASYAVHALLAATPQTGKQTRYSGSAPVLGPVRTSAAAVVDCP